MTTPEKTASPYSIFRDWYNEMLSNPPAEPAAMILATASSEGRVSSRVVLMKDYNERGFYFFTNYNSHKAMQLESNNQAALLFYWPGQRRQIRVEGRVFRISDSESDAYFKTRPAESRLGAWASEQSKTIDSPDVLTERMNHFRNMFGDDIPRPPHWGGYVLVPEMFEFWEEGEHRLHNRLVFNSKGEGWVTKRVAP